MCKKFLSLLICIFYAKGDLIEIEIEVNDDNMCSKPKFYRSEFSGPTLKKIDEIFNCSPYEDNVSFSNRVSQNDTTLEMFRYPGRFW